MLRSPGCVHELYDLGRATVAPLIRAAPELGDLVLVGVAVAAARLRAHPDIPDRRICCYIWLPRFRSRYQDPAGPHHHARCPDFASPGRITVLNEVFPLGILSRHCALQTNTRFIYFIVR